MTTEEAQATTEESKTLAINAVDAAALDEITLPLVLMARSAMVSPIPNRGAARPVASGKFEPAAPREQTRADAS